MQAQPSIPDAKTIYTKLQNAILAKQLAVQGLARGTGISKRLTGTSLYSGTTLTDSLRNVYSGGRGSTHPNDGSYVSNVDNQESTFIATDPLSVQYIQSDTSWTYHLNGTNTLRNMTVSRYDGNNLLTKEIYFNALNTADAEYHENIITYRTNGQRSTVLTRDTIGGMPLADKQTDYFIYDAQNRIIMDSLVFMSSPFVKTHYSYNAAGYLSTYLREINNGSSWENSFKVEFTYDGSNRLVNTVYASYNSSHWTNNFRDTMGYAGPAAQYTYRSLDGWNAANNSWDVTNSLILVLNGSSNQIKSWYAIYDNNPSGFDTLSRLDYFYNAAGLYERTEESRYIGNGNFAAPSRFSNYYYEDYLPTGVGNVNKGSGDLVIYPNPVTHALFVKGNDVAEYTIISVNGSVSRCIPAANNSGQIDVNSLPPGIYFMVAKDKDGQPTAKGQFVKQ